MSYNGNGFAVFTNFKETPHQQRTPYIKLEEDKSFILRLWRTKYLTPYKEITLLSELYNCSRDEIIQFLYAYDVKDDYIINKIKQKK